jgi:hypothetical protein
VLKPPELLAHVRRIWLPASASANGMSPDQTRSAFEADRFSEHRGCMVEIGQAAGQGRDR